MCLKNYASLCWSDNLHFSEFFRDMLIYPSFPLLICFLGILSFQWTIWKYFYSFVRSLFHFCLFFLIHFIFILKKEKKKKTFPKKFCLRAFPMQVSNSMADMCVFVGDHIIDVSHLSKMIYFSKSKTVVQ